MERYSDPMNMTTQENVTEVNMGIFKEDRCYRPDEIADQLHVDKSTVYRLIKDMDHPLPAFRIKEQGQLRCYGRDINKYLEDHKVRPEYE